ncbi:ATP-binding protein, partial [Echinicola sediminis]
KEIGKVPNQLANEPAATFPEGKLNSSEFLFEIPKIASYHISNGNKIIVQPKSNADLASVRLFMLSNAFAGLLFQRSSVPFHAGAIITNKKDLLLIMGHSGTGKSTLVSELRRRGYQLFSDDVVVFQKNDSTKDSFMVSASYPMIKLFSNSISNLNDDRLKKNHVLKDNKNKHGIYFHEEFSTEELPVKKIIVLNPTEMNTTYTHQYLTGLKAIIALHDNIYRHKFDASYNNDFNTFNMLSIIAKKVQVIEVSRDKEKSNIEDFGNYVENLI